MASVQRCKSPCRLPGWVKAMPTSAVNAARHARSSINPSARFRSLMSWTCVTKRNGLPISLCDRDTLSRIQTGCPSLRR